MTGARAVNRARRRSGLARSRAAHLVGQHAGVLDVAERSLAVLDAKRDAVDVDEGLLAEVEPQHALESAIDAGAAHVAHPVHLRLSDAEHIELLDLPEVRCAAQLLLQRVVATAREVVALEDGLAPQRLAAPAAKHSRVTLRALREPVDLWVFQVGRRGAHLPGLVLHRRRF